MSERHLASERVGQFFLETDGGRDRLEYTEYGTGDAWVVLLPGELMPRRMQQPLAHALAAEARRLYEQALALQPDFPEALNNLGLIEGRTGNLPVAEQRFRAALAKRPTYGDAANNLALVLVATQRGTEAVAMLEAFLQRDPSFENAWVTLARIHLAAGRTTDGLRAVEQLLQRNPSHPIGLALAREYRPK